MPRKSKSWQHSLVKQALEAHGLNKVTFSLNGELTTVATNDYCIYDYLSPHLSSQKRDEPVAVRGIYDAWCTSCRQAEALWLKLATSEPGLQDSPSRGVDGCDPSGGTNPGKPLSPYRILPCAASLADDEWNCPYMPRQGGMYLHTRKGGMFYNGAASRPVAKSEIRQSKAAQEAMDYEWQRLVDKDCFDFNTAFPSTELTSLARSGKRKKCHIGLVFGICVEKDIQHSGGGRKSRFKGR